MSEDHIHYPVLIDQAMRGVVHDVLKRVQASGLPGEHHFYISFSTTYPGVRISDQLKSRYSKEITIVLQHQFWDFKVEDKQFQVTLSFSGSPEKLTVPFAALTAFADPSIKFGLQFQQPTSEAEAVQVIPPALPVAPVSAAVPAVKEEAANSAEVISLDSFRNKK